MKLVWKYYVSDTNKKLISFGKKYPLENKKNEFNLQFSVQIVSLKY